MSFPPPHARISTDKPQPLKPPVFTVKGGGRSTKKRNLALFRVSLEEDAVLAAAEVLRSGWIGEGERAKEFEALVGGLLGQQQVLALNSCTSALVLALRLAGAGPGTEVVTTPMTCTATNHAILQGGASIVWADIDPVTGNIDPASVRSRITERTKAIVAVHWGGTPCDLDTLNEIAREHGISVVEDAAHAFGSEYRGRLIGGHSDFVCLSFQAIKMITTGDGGALVCSSRADYERGKLLRWFGIPRGVALGSYDITEFGYKFHMNDISAALGIAGMAHYQEYLSLRRRNGLLYERLLQGIPGISVHKEEPHERSAFWLACALVERRDDFIRKLADAGIAASPVHLRNDAFTVFSPFNGGPLPGVDAFNPMHVSLPVGPWISEEDVHYVAETIRQGW
jgi:perosamine synthetase